MSEDARPESEVGATLLDNETDREELRDRYYGLLQELRVVVTGVQVLLAFLLTAPFATRFGELDESAQAWFGAALACATVSVVAFVTPTAMHRFGDRTARAERLQLSIVVTRIGLFFFGLAMLLSFGVVAGFLFSGPVAAALISVAAVAMLGLWVVAPLAVRASRHR